MTFWRNDGAKLRPFGFIEPCIPTRADKVPTGPEWVHEIKHDGYRLIVCRREGRVRLFTRRGYDWTHRYPMIVAAAAGLAHDATIDGEVVVRDDAGIANFARLHGNEHDRQAILYAFDLLVLDGTDVRPPPLSQRKDRLRRLLRGDAVGIQFNEHIEGDGDQVFAQACKLGFEGIVSKDRRRPYRSGRSKTWLKIKNPQAPGVLRFEDRDELA